MGHNSFQFDFFLRKIGTVQRFQPAPYPFDTDPLSPCGFRQTAPAQTVTDQKSLLFIRKEKQIMQQQPRLKRIKSVVRRGTRHG
jgi:hypothetical protein